ncbi:COG3415 family protein [Anabaenopsis elenkinii]|jgi:hypothetical protein|uniref:Transposase n=1 Tax=Anabaenopsis elenkinii CCIBt3563 TaxID=2779889 RepID=A0A7S6RET6_9CYAN|nr:hypothetical protein IM676_04710 [Anabaenopsis elenkinii CCIBt3563]
MKAYSIDLREKIISVYEAGNTSIRKVAERFKVSKNTVQDAKVLYIVGFLGSCRGINISLSNCCPQMVGTLIEWKLPGMAIANGC